MGITKIKLKRSFSNGNADVLSALQTGNMTLSYGEPLWFKNSFYGSAKLFVGDNSSNPLFIGPYYSDGSLSIDNDPVSATLGLITVGPKIEDASEVAAAALNDLNLRTKALEDLVHGGDYIEVQKLVVTRELSGVALQSDWNQTDSTALNYIWNKPTIPTVPTNVSSFTNDAGYITSADIPSEVFLCTFTINEANENIECDKTFAQITQAYNDGKVIVGQLYTVCLYFSTVPSQGFMDFTNVCLLAGMQSIISIYWNNSSNKWEYETFHVQQRLVSGTNIKTINGNSILGSGNLQINYNELSDLPTIPTVNNAMLTIQKNGTTIDTFTANASQDKTINITVPTSASDVSALPSNTKYGSSLSLSLDDSYKEVSNPAGHNPKNEGWYERTGTYPNYIYKLTDATEPVSGVTYYTGPTWVISMALKDQDGNVLGSQQSIDLPLESVVVKGRYDSSNKLVVLTLKDGSEIPFSVADLVSGLQTEITSNNKLSADLVQDGTTNKVFTATEKTKLSGIAEGAEVNVQPDWNQTNSSADDYIKNKPTIPVVPEEVLFVVFSESNDSLVCTATVAEIEHAYLNKECIFAVYDDGREVRTFYCNKPTQFFGIPKSNNVGSELDNISIDMIEYVNNTWVLYKSFVPQKEINSLNKLSSDYLSNGTNNKLFTSALKTKLDGIAEGAEVNVNADWDATSGDAEILHKPTIPSTTSQLTNDSGYITASDIPQEVFYFTLIQGSNNAITSSATATDIAAAFTAGKAIVCKYISNNGNNIKYYHCWFAGDTYIMMIGFDGIATTIELGNPKVFSAGIDAIVYNTDTWLHYASFSIGEKITDFDGKIDCDLLVNGTTNKVFTATEKTKLDGIAEGAEVNIQSDWNQTDTSADDYIKNKPTIPTVPTNVSDFNNDAGYISQYSVIYCDTASATRNKEGKCPLSSLTAESYYVVMMVNENTYSSNYIRLNVNGIGNRGIYINGEPSGSSNYTLPAGIYIVYYDGYYFYFRTDGKIPLKNAAFSGSYNELADKPTIPAAQVNSDWEASSGAAQILNKPNIEDATEVAAASLNDLHRRILALESKVHGGDIIEVQKLSVSREVELPAGTIPAAQVNSDWNASSGVAQILNKPTIPTVNNATLTIQQNGTNVDTFTANASSDKTINIQAQKPILNSSIGVVSGSTGFGLYKPDGSTLYSSTDFSDGDYVYIATGMCSGNGSSIALSDGSASLYIYGMEDDISPYYFRSFEIILARRASENGLFVIASNRAIMDATHLKRNIVYVQSGAATADFGSQRSYCIVSTNSNFTLNMTITPFNQAENYVFIHNSGSSDITVSIGTVNNGSNNIPDSAINLPEDPIVIAAGTSVELSVLIYSTFAVITVSDKLVTKASLS